MENSNPNNKQTEKIGVNGMNFEIRPNWKDNDINEINKYKLTPEKQLEKRIQRVSKNYHKASSEYRNYLESLRSNERIFWGLCRSVSPIRNKSKEKNKSSTTFKGKSTDDLNVHAKNCRDSDGTNFQTNHKTESRPNHRGRSKRVCNSHARNACSLPPNLEQQHKVNSNSEFEAIKNTENHKEVDLFLTNVVLQSCIEKYSRRLYNICKMIDLDSEDELDDEAYFEEICYGVPDRLIGENRIEDPKGPVETSVNFVKAKENTIENRACTQPQISNETISETINETASKWSTRLRANPNSNSSPSFDTRNYSSSSSPKKLSKATRSRLILKERIGNMNLSEVNISRQIDINNRYTCKNTNQISDTKNHPIANVIVTQNTHISKQPFSSLFNI
ncbi:uncharacterized protein ELE39_003099 [Cryptosporidium sp. chipmunk genotype I]|uniref:uncharacterized protein n=1 Tax=Cryptosporidium sp. chipmunk genotype I TaxID=1280935 RepID=UPI00351A0E55|nr:hypothetical protein ELE39_003099 [Cryptosporidium sp. chipmunk genotype I]